MVLLWLEDEEKEKQKNGATNNGKKKMSKRFRDNTCHICGIKVSSPKCRNNAKDHICDKCTQEKNRITKRKRKDRILDSKNRY